MSVHLEVNKCGCMSWTISCHSTKNPQMNKVDIISLGFQRSKAFFSQNIVPMIFSEIQSFISMQVRRRIKCNPTTIYTQLLIINEPILIRTKNGCCNINHTKYLHSWSKKEVFTMYSMLKIWIFWMTILGQADLQGSISKANGFKQIPRNTVDVQYPPLNVLAKMCFVQKCTHKINIKCL